MSENTNITESRPAKLATEVKRSGVELPKSILAAQAKKDFVEQISHGVFSSNEVDKFINERVSGVIVNGVRVVIIDFNHKDDEIDPIAEAYIKSGKTKLVVAEYFYPEIKNNAGAVGLGSLMQKVGRKMSPQIDFAEKLTNVCRDANKLVAVTDIADKAGFVSAYVMFRAAPQIAALGLSGMQPELIQKMYPLISLVFATWLAGLSIQNILDMGIYSKEKISEWDKYILDFEQARRMYAARGIEQLTHEYPPTGQPGKEESQIVVMYPKAHGIRIADNLVNPHRGLDKAKNIIYKIFGPGLDFSVRKWEWKDSLKKLADSGYRWGKPDIQPTGDKRYDSSDLENWRLVSERKIEI